MMTKDKLRQLTGDERLGQMRESEYLGAEDIDDGTEPVLTIAGLWYGSVTLQRGKENKDVLSFKEERVPGSFDILLLKHCTSFLRLNTVIAERNRTAKVAVFIPPAVEPGEPPISIRMIIMAVPDSSIAARSVVLKPAVRVVTD